MLNFPGGVSDAGAQHRHVVSAENGHGTARLGGAVDLAAAVKHGEAARRTRRYGIDR
ncbi:Uncharacterised protein [Leclercia adecarboxylata]|uniref:Uncharacterized protein n=1 Tax=Leclercia adecarboxylata TaxID=83655 RepID=A0A4U9ICE0_9ENTR|nr:Uncharacterised protein [Leclercia adecarboxylata]